MRLLSIFVWIVTGVLHWNAVGAEPLESWEVKFRATNLIDVTVYKDQLFMLTRFDPPRVYRSTNAVDWHDVALPTDRFWQAYTIAANQSMLVVGGDECRVITSPDGIQWQERYREPFSRGINSDAAYGNGRLLICSVYSSAHPFGGSSVSGLILSDNETLNRAGSAGSYVAFGKTNFVAIRGNSINVSQNGFDWTSRQLPNLSIGTAIGYGDGIFVIGTQRGEIYLSIDEGNTWSERSSPITSRIGTIAYGGGYYLAAGDGVLLISTNGTTWKQQTLPGKLSRFSFTSAVYWRNSFVVIGSSVEPNAESIVIQSDRLLPEETGPRLSSPAFVGQSFSFTTLISTNGTTRVQRSPDLLNWSDFVLLTNSPQGSLLIEDREAAHSPRRFYRTITQ